MKHFGINQEQTLRLKELREALAVRVHQDGEVQFPVANFGCGSQCYSICAGSCVTGCYSGCKFYCTGMCVNGCTQACRAQAK